MHVVKRCDQTQGIRLQQPIAKHIARHVADTDRSDGISLHIDTQLPEMSRH